jgi:hypothetical protein
MGLTEIACRVGMNAIGDDLDKNSAIGSSENRVEGWAHRVHWTTGLFRISGRGDKVKVADSPNANVRRLENNPSSETSNA